MPDPLSSSIWSSNRAIRLVRFFAVCILIGTILGALGGALGYLVLLLIPGVTQAQRALVIPLFTIAFAVLAIVLAFQARGRIK